MEFSKNFMNGSVDSNIDIDFSSLYNGFTIRSMKNIFTFILAFLILCPAAFGLDDQALCTLQEEDEREESKGEIFKIRFHAFVEDGKFLFSFPKRINKKGMIMTGTFLLSTAVFVHFDEDLRDAVRRNRGEGLDRIADFFEPLGKAEINFAECGLLYLAARISDDDYFRETSLLALESLIYTGLITSVSKVTFGREGPSSGRQWGSFFNGSDLFPSGHTSRSFSIATVFAERYKDEKRFIPYIAYGTASMIALSTVIQDTHWASDIFAGAALGILIGKTITRLHSGDLDRSSLMVAPSISISSKKVELKFTINFQT